MQFLRRSLVGLVLLSLTLGLFAVAGATFWGAVQERMGREARERPARERVMAVNTVAIRPERIAPVMTAFGEIQSRRTLEIRSQAGGRIVMLAEGFEDGAAVSGGALLARVDPTDAEAALAVSRTDLAEAEAELRDAERALALAGDELAAARAQADLRAQALARQRDLADRGVGTAAAVEDAALAESSAGQAVLARRQALATAESRVDQARNRLARTRIALANAERDLAETEIRATFDGTLAEVAVVEGGVVTPNERIATLIDPEALEVVFRLSTAQYARLLDDEGALITAPVEVTLDVLGIGLVATGRISRVGADVGEGQTGRRIFARLESFAGFRPGDFVSVSVREPALEGVALLPSTALDAAGTVLVVGPEDRLQAASVELLRRQGDEVIVRAEGLAGARVVAERTPLVGPGIKVRDLTAERGSETLGFSGGGGNAPGTPERAGAERQAAAERIALSPERRAALIAAVEGNPRMPEEARARVLAQLQQETVPAAMVARIEDRMGG